MNIRIAPSLLAADFARLDREIVSVQKAGADMLHLDLMDGHFVPNLTFGPPVVRQLTAHAQIPLDAHLMVTDADVWLAPLAASGVARVAVHVEACPHLHRTLSAIRELGMSPGIALNPATPVSALEEALAWTDFVLVMSVNPGFGGQTFIPEMVNKVARIRAMGPGEEIDISVDGGVGPANVKALVTAGATTLVAGSSVFGEHDRAAAIGRLRSLVSQGVHS